MATKKLSPKKATPKKSSASAIKAKPPKVKKAVATPANPTKSIAKSVVKPASKSTTQSASKVVSTSASKIAAKPAAKSASNATSHSASSKPTVKPVEETLVKSVKLDTSEDVVLDNPTLSTAELLAPKTTVVPSVKSTISSGVFKGYQQVQDRIFLSNPKSYGEIPDLLELQKKGYRDFLELYLPKLFDDVNPIRDIGGNKLNVMITDIKVSEPIESIEICKKKELTYGGIITAKIKLVEIIEDEKTKKKSEKVLFSKRANVGILPIMTPSATYIINGVERVIISQIVRSYGIFYSKKEGRYSCKLIPENGPRLEIDVEKFGTIVARINKSRKFPITALFRIFGIEKDEEIRAFFQDSFEEEDVNYIDITLKKDRDTTDAISAAEFIYNKLRPGELIDPQSALDYVKAQFMDPMRIYVGRIARRKINAKL
ncbi:MAG: hypothetical protein LBG59_03835 [Candidatus Peribacteria bacterium]|jgi:hypothetical protein|nr:hypothetical protein [Candidatus Peribacteria bacterium]